MRTDHPPPHHTTHAQDPKLAKLLRTSNLRPRTVLSRLEAVQRRVAASPLYSSGAYPLAAAPDFLAFLGERRDATARLAAPTRHPALPRCLR